ncbi:MAG TPA: response regulator [Dictyobacter sp.]|nr:response regulator [Dictyobacter sp.]
MRVGLLEDDVAIQEMLLLVLQDEGYEVVNFPGADACLVALGITVPQQDPVTVDLMIIDWRLNESMNGTDVIQQIRSQAHLQQLPIILTTAAAFSDTEALQDLHVSFMEKPFSVDDMIALIKQLTHS